MKYQKITYPDVNNGLGCRATLWVSGCTHHCKGCHNKCTWSFDKGKEYDESVEEKMFSLISEPYIKGLTLSGGDPLDNYDSVLGIVKRFRERFGNEKDIWLYTGYVLSDVMLSDKREILDYVDYAVDGEFNISLKDITLAFRGSSNQIIWEKNSDGDFVKSILNDDRCLL